MPVIDFFVNLLSDPYGAIYSWLEMGLVYAYAFIFLIIFIETGVVFMPFLPGDSLLFAAGIFAHSAHVNGFDIVHLLLLVWSAAIVGDQCNFFIGHFFGKRIIASGKIKAMTPERIAKSEAFLDKWGHLAIFLGRFFPFIRTFVPFLAGVGGMKWHSFVLFNILGGITWSSAFTLLGYFFGGFEVVKTHFEFIVIGIIAISLIPMIAGLIKAKLSGKKGDAPADKPEGSHFAK